ncbi:hypothetical protein [Spiroplasma eriocheiris]|uniref:Uncharacterized protein n=1 Tax=Spiroplasma eriocheiris TaxID=315358 RepID=A0A0H3XNE6_9MOLU|nr:hypothetical protein [Spiroplasma eriocheiris]AHF58307.1 hypothetical protein SPE_1195 [Spiroplasma eriocheiris CCTCC M 207170]AKM54742.1 hypothetical protein SERIO_v1c11930 [Spiroplasma eriocheiris]
MSINTKAPASLFILEEIKLKLEEETKLFLNELISLEILDQQSFKTFADFKMGLLKELSQISTINANEIVQFFNQKENLVFIEKNEYFKFKASIFNMLANATPQEVSDISLIFESFEHQRKEHVSHNSFFIEWMLIQKKILQELKGKFNTLDSITQSVFQNDSLIEPTKDLMEIKSIRNIINLLNDVKNALYSYYNNKIENYSKFKNTVFPVFDFEILKEDINNEMLLAEIQRLFKDYHEKLRTEQKDHELDFSKQILQNRNEIILSAIGVFNEKVNLIKKNKNNIDNNTR